MKIGDREIGNGQPCYIIAEAGTAHLGSLRVALDLVDAAARAGADAVKFQMFVPSESLFCPLEGDDKRRPRWNASAMGFAAWEAVAAHCAVQGIHFLASAFQPTAVEWLKRLDAVAYKVASRAAATYPYDAVPGPFIISMGGSWVLPTAPCDFIRLQCAMKYPIPLNKARWRHDENRLEQNGLSDHSGTPWPGLDAMARGCKMLEVHFTIPGADPGNDAPVCLSTDQLKLLCEARDGFAALRSN